MVDQTYRREHENQNQDKEREDNSMELVIKSETENVVIEEQRSKKKNSVANIYFEKIKKKQEADEDKK